MNDRSVAIKGGLWTGVSTVVTLLTQMLRLIILTRFLEKSDFGVVSITNTIIMFCLTFTDLGFASVIMYKKDLSKEEFSSLYWIQAILFVTLYLLLCVSSPLIASYYEADILKSLITISGLSIIGQAIGKLYDSVLLKAYQFKSLAYRNIITNVASLLLAWLMAVSGYGVYSLVYSTLFQLLVYNIWNIIKGYRIQPFGLCLNIKTVIPLIKIGVYETGTHILDFISNKIDVFIIGKLLGMEALGVYDLAKELVQKFMSLVRTVVAKVALPILANNNSDDEAVRVRFLSMTKVVAYICIPFCLTFAVFSEPIIRIVYGSNYLEAVPLVSIFAIVSVIGSLTGLFDLLGIAKGRTDLNFRYTVYRIFITTPVVVVTSMISILAVAYGHLVVGVIGTIIYWNTVVMKTYPMSPKEYCSSFGKLLLSTTIVSLVIVLLRITGVFDIFSLWEISFLVQFVLFAFLLLMALFFFMRSDLLLLRSYVKK